MDLPHEILVVIYGGHVIAEEMRDGGQETRLQRRDSNSSSWARRLPDVVTGGMGGTEGADQMLLAQHVEMGPDRKDLGLRVKVGDG